MPKPNQPKTSRPQNTLALISLSLGYFTIGATSLSVIGLLAPISYALNIPAASVALLVTVFALGFALSAPTAQLLFGHQRRKDLLIAGLILMSLGNLLAATASSFTVLVIARVLAAVGAGLYGPVSTATATALVEPHWRGRAIGTVFGGMTLATVFGVPLTSVLGYALGWQAALGVIALTGLAALIAVIRFVPIQTTEERPSLVSYLSVLSNTGAVLTFAVTLLHMAAQFTVYALAAAVLKDRFTATPAMISGTLLAFGVGGVIGNTIATRLTDQIGSARVVLIALAGTASTFIALNLIPANPILAAVVFATWAIFGVMLQTPQQARVVTLLPELRGIGLALNASALYLGISLGSFIGGNLYRDHGATSLPPVALGLLGIALIAFFGSERWRIRNPSIPQT